MRELKFRSWNGEQMISPDYITRDAIGHWKENSIPSYSKYLMQFTGVKDKNGADIYEDDIIAIFSDAQIVKGKLVQIKDFEIYSIKYLKGGFFASENDDLSIGFYNEMIEVIGNIFEDSELLT
jgi:uncharacterized phage protein (TIGR01671 family)